MKRLLACFALLLCVSGCGGESKSAPVVLETYNNVSYKLNQDLTFNVVHYEEDKRWDHVVISDFYYVVKNSTSSPHNTFYVCEGELYYLVVYYVQK